MKFSELYNQILQTLITEDEETQGIDGVDEINPDQESALGGEGGERSDIDTKRLVDLTNLLLNALRFKPSDEFRAYLKMPKFHNLSAFQKLTTIRNVLSDHPERIIKEEDENLEDFGKGELTGLSETEEMDLLRLIIRSVNVNPYAMSITLKELPSEADESNFEQIIETIEGVLF